MHTSSMNLLQRLSAVAATTAMVGMGSATAIAASANINTNLTTGNGTTTAYQSNTTANPGDLVNFKVLLQNTGDATGTNPRITDTLDSHLSYIKNSSVEYTKQGNSEQGYHDVQMSVPDSYIKFNGQQITWGFSNIDTNNESAIYLTFQARVAGNDQFNIGQSTLVNQAVSSFDGISLATNTVNIVVTKAATAAPALADRTEVTDVTKGNARWYGANQAGSVTAGDTIRYRVIVANTGTAAAQNVTVKDSLPAGVTFAGNVKLYDNSNSGTAVNSDSIVKGGYVIANLPNGNDHAVTLTFDAKVTGACSNDNMINGTSISYNGKTVASDSAAVLDSCTNGLVITKQVQDPKDGIFKNQIGPVAPGTVLNYRVIVINNGSATVNNPTVRDMLATDETFVPVSLTIDGEHQIVATTNYFFGTKGMILTNLTPGLGKQIEYQVTVGACAASTQDVKNVAYVHGDNVVEISAIADTSIASCVTPTPAPTATPAPSATPTAPATHAPVPVTQLPTTGPELALLVPAALSGAGILARRKQLVTQALKKAIRGINVL